jgi:Plavaka transposase
MLMRSNFTGKPCDEHGNFLPPDAPPPPQDTNRSPDDWTPYNSRLEFEFADFIFRTNEMPAMQINTLLDLWAASMLKHGDTPPFANFQDLHNTIDSTPLGDVPWQSFKTRYQDEKPQQNIPLWMDAGFDVWFRDPCAVIQNMLANPDFNGEIDYAPLREFKANGDRRYQNLMSGDWAWEQAVFFSFSLCLHLFNIPV